MSMGEQNHIDCRKLLYLFANFPDAIRQMLIVWECEYLLAKASFPTLQSIALAHKKNNGRLILRDAVRGGKCEVFLTHLSNDLLASGSRSKKIKIRRKAKIKTYFFDKNSQYPDVVMKKGMPCGKPITVSGQDAVDLVFICNSQFFLH